MTAHTQPSLKLVAPNARPTSPAEYLARTKANTKYSGVGLATMMHVPCPFCGAAEFVVCAVIGGAERAFEKGATCRECNRGCRAIFTRSAPGSLGFEFVQTGGDEPPDWLTPKMRRVDQPAGAD